MQKVKYRKNTKEIPDNSSLPLVSIDVANTLILMPSMPVVYSSFSSNLAAKSKYLRCCSCLMDCCRSMNNSMYFGFVLLPGGKDKFMNIHGFNDSVCFAVKAGMPSPHPCKPIRSLGYLHGPMNFAHAVPS